MEKLRVPIEVLHYDFNVLAVRHAIGGADQPCGRIRIVGSLRYIDQLLKLLKSINETNAEASPSRCVIGIRIAYRVFAILA